MILWMLLQQHAKDKPACHAGLQDQLFKPGLTLAEVGAVSDAILAVQGHLQ